MDEGDEIALMFLKGHKSPKRDSVTDDVDQDITCSTHCYLKSILFHYISVIDQEESIAERATMYMHAFNDLFLAIEEIEERLERLLPGSDSNINTPMTYDL